MDFVKKRKKDPIFGKDLWGLGQTNSNYSKLITTRDYESLNFDNELLDRKYNQINTRDNRNGGDRLDKFKNQTKRAQLKETHKKNFRNNRLKKRLKRKWNYEKSGNEIVARGALGYRPVNANRNTYNQGIIHPNGNNWDYRHIGGGMYQNNPNVGNGN